MSFIAALFTIAKTWKQPKYPSIDEWIKKMWGFPHAWHGKECACNAGDSGSISGSGRSPGEGNGNPLQHSYLENPMDGGAWQATVLEVAKRWTQLSGINTHGLLLSHKKEWNNAICSKVGGPRDYHNKQSQRKTNITWHYLSMEFKIWHKSTYPKNRNRLTDIENRLVVSKRWGVEKDGLWVWD